MALVSMTNVQYLLNWYCLHIYHLKPTRLLAKQPELLLQSWQPWWTHSHGQPLSLDPRRSVRPADIPGQTHKAAGRGCHFHIQPLSAAQPPHATRWPRPSEVICMASQEAPLFPTPFNLQQVQRRYYQSTPCPVQPGAEAHLLYLRMLFVNYSLAFNTTVNMYIPQKLWILGLYTSVCNWIVSFLTDKPQMLLMTHDCAAKHSSFRKCKVRGHNPILRLRGIGGFLLRTPWCAHQWGPLLDHSHHCSFKDGTRKTVSPEKTEERWTECLCTVHLWQVNQLLAPSPSSTAAASWKPFSTRCPRKTLKTTPITAARDSSRLLSAAIRLLNR